MNVMQDSDRVHVLARIDSLVVDLLQQLAHRPDERQRPAPLRLSSTCPIEPGGDDTQLAEQKTMRPVVFPTRAASGVRRFGECAHVGQASCLCCLTYSSQYLRVLEVVQSNLLARRLVTKRDVFDSQRASDMVVERLAQMLCCTRASLGIVASTRGVMSGSFELCSPGGASVRCARGEMHRVPADINTTWTVRLPCPADCTGHTVLVVEKAGVFQRILDLNRDACDKVIVITACGYADTATLQLVRLLSATRCQGGVSMCGLFDGDPYGIDIHTHYTAAAHLEWLGVDADEFDFAPETHTALRADERTKAMRLLSSPSSAREMHRHRLTNMLLGGYKVQIDAAYHWPGGLGAYLDHKLALHRAAN
nr:meiosis-specific topoisomerase [Moesziomyces parantarcticus]